MDRIVHLWQKIPVIIRAVVVGLFVQFVGFAVLIAVIPLNFRIFPEVPWAVLPLGAALWAYWTYFGGGGWPRNQADVRRHLRRSNSVPRALLRPVIVAGGLFSITVVCVGLLQYSLRVMPAEALGLAANLATLPLWTSIPLALASAFFVGVGEELSFRGYMQVPIEERHGPWLGLTVPALVFALAHGVDLVILPTFFLVSIGWSYLAWRLDSIRPGIIFHTLIDSFSFLWIIFRIEDIQRVMDYSLIDDGMTTGYWVFLTITIFLCIATLAAFWMLHRATYRESSKRVSVVEAPSRSSQE